MIGLVPASVAWPLLACPLLAVLPGRGGGRTMAAGTIVAAGSTTLLAASALAWPLGATVPAAAAAPWLDDRLARSLALLVTVPWLLVSVGTAGSRSRRSTAGPPWRRWQVAAQLATGGAVLACRADPLFLMLVGVALLLAGAALLHDGDRHQAVLFGTILLPAWLGVAVLGVGSGRPPRWDALGGGMPAAAHPLLMLLVLPMLLLAWIGALGPGVEGALPQAGTGSRIARALLPVPVAAPVLDVVLRLRPGLDGETLIGIGLLGLLLAVGLMPARRDLEHRVSLAAAVQLCGAVIGLGVGGASGIAAALMILLFLALSLPVALLPPDRSRGGPVGRLAVLAVAGMPPFGPFLAGFVLLPGVFATAPLPAVLLLAGFGCSALSLLSALRVIHPAAEPAGRVAMLPGVLVLALLFWLGLAMPDALSGWLLDLGEAASGNGAAR